MRARQGRLAAVSVPGQGAVSADPWLDHEDAVVRLARIVLLATALADRPRASAPGSPQRLARLLDGADLARRALLAAARLEALPA